MLLLASRGDVCARVRVFVDSKANAAVSVHCSSLSLPHAIAKTQRFHDWIEFSCLALFRFTFAAPLAPRPAVFCRCASVESQKVTGAQYS